MKKITILIIGILTVFLISWGIKFAHANLRGIKPAFLPSPKSTTTIFESTPSISKTGVNTTGLPLKIPNGFAASVYARDLGNPRVLTWDPSGNLLVSIPAEGTIVALPDKNADGKSDKTVTVVTGLNKPYGMAFHDKKLYIAETNKVSYYSYNSSSFTVSDKIKVVDLPSGGNHFSRTIGFGPEGKLYITIGSSCNVCKEKDIRRSTMLIANPDGTNLREFASGLRNSVFFTWHPVTGMLWATEMGRDLIGDEIPPDEINIVDYGKFYGWPYCYGKKVHDASFDTSENSVTLCKNSQASYIDIPAHSAPLGLAFVPAKSSWPKEYWNNLLVSYHGSWNRTIPTGYKVVRYKLDEQGVYFGEEDFISGWLTKEGALGRPVDLKFDTKGNLFITDDKAGVIYKVTPPVNK